MRVFPAWRALLSLVLVSSSAWSATFDPETGEPAAPRDQRPAEASVSSAGESYRPGSAIAAAAGTMFATNGSSLHIIDKTTGAPTLVGSHGVGLVGGLVFDGNGTLFGLGYGTGSVLYTIDTTTGAATLVGSLTIGFVFEGALVIDGSGQLFGVDEGNAGAARTFNINPTTGVSTTFGTPQARDINGMTSDGVNIYAIDRPSNTFGTVDVTTGRYTPIGNPGVTVGSIGGLAFDPTSGLIYATMDGTGEFYEINPTTGAATLIGIHGTFHGLAVVPCDLGVVPIAAAGADAVICSGESFDLDGSGSTHPSCAAGLEYRWLINGVPLGPWTSSPVLPVTPASTTTYTLAVRCASALECVVTDSIIVSVTAAPSAAAGADVTVCVDDPVQLDGGGTIDLGCPAGVAYTWLDGATTVATSQQWSPPTSAAGTTAYTLVASCVGSTGCETSDDVVVTVAPPPVADAGTDVTACAGDIVTLDAGATIDLGCPAGVEYEWRDGATIVATGSTWFPPTTAGSTTYTLVARCIGLAGCETNDVVAVVLAPNPTAVAGADVTVCAGGAVTLDGSGSIDAGCPNGVAYAWLDGATTVSTAAQWSPPTATAGATTYTLVASCIGLTGCETSDLVTVTVAPPPTGAAGADVVVCAGDAVVLDASGTVDLGCPAGVSYVWLNGATVVANTAQWSPPTTVSGTTAYTLLASCVGLTSCETSDAVTVDVIALPVAVAGPDQQECRGGAVVLDGSASIDVGCPNGIAYEWLLGATPVATTPTWMPPTGVAGTTTYTLVIRCVGAPECPVSDTVDVQIELCLDVSWDAYGARWSTQSPQAVEVSWRTLLEEGTVAFVVERAATSGDSFAMLGSAVAALGPGVDYLFVDSSVAAGERPWYRVVEYTADGRGDTTPAFQVAAPGGRPRR